MLLLLLFAFSLCGCKESYMEDYNIGMIYTKEYKEDTKLVFLDETMEPVDEISFSYSNMSYDGFANALEIDGRVFFLPKGHGDKLDFGKVISMRLTDGKVEEYDFDRINMTSFTCDGNWVYATSNLNGISYLDRYDRETKKIVSMETENMITDVIVAGNGSLFGFASDLESGKCYLGQFDIDLQKSMMLHELKKEETPAFLQFYKDVLLFVDDDILYRYNVERKTVEQIMLPHDGAYNLARQEEKLYIGYTNLFEDNVSYVNVYDLDKQEITRDVTYQGTILQMEISKENPDHLFLLDYDKLIKIDLAKGKVLCETEALEEKEYYIGGFFLKE